ncbi:MAG: cyclase family protein [Cryomorphaceae bacterium]|nr:cyclase family protein [Cryomorphaceae bacterium]
MTADIHIADQRYRVNLNQGVDLSIGFDAKKGPLAWGVGHMQVNPVVYGDWVGLVREGASVNFCDVLVNPHGQGTHTECVGHISKSHDSVQNYLTRYWFPALLYTADVVNGVVDLSGLPLPDNDWSYQAIIIRSRPNTTDKRSRVYSGQNPPHFNPDVLRQLSNMGVAHFLTDLPSVDPEEDGGALAAHKAFFLDSKGEKRLERTITELIYAPNDLKDGRYILNLQIAPLTMDAVPSRPVVYAV